MNAWPASLAFVIAYLLVYYPPPLWASILGFIFLREEVTFRQALSGAVALVGVWIASSAPAPLPRRVEP